MTEEGYSDQPLDVTTLDLFSRRAATHALIERSLFSPDRLSPRMLVLHLDAGQYPSPIVTARLDVRWFEGGDYSFHYLESDGETRWQCRWDRHPKPDTPRSHFHPPPDAKGIEHSEVDADHPLGVLFVILDWVSSRVEQTHG